MSKNETLVDGQVAAATSTKKARKPSVSAAQFYSALKAGSVANPKQTAQQVADSLGMEKTSFDQRLNQARNEWKRDTFIADVKFRGATAESLKLSKAEYDAKLAEVKVSVNEDGKAITSMYDALTEQHAKFFNGAFPWVLADGRSGGNGREGGSARNAILAALQAVDA